MALDDTGVFQTPSGRKAERQIASQNATAFHIAHGLTKPQDICRNVLFPIDPLLRADDVNRVEMLSGFEPNTADVVRLLNAILAGEEKSPELTLDMLKQILQIETDYYMIGSSNEQVRKALNDTGVFQTPSGRKAERLIASQGATAFT